jgi:4-amino-4-deoxy-L-arabinose transferase-like glycosyltransferase
MSFCPPGLEKLPLEKNQPTGVRWTAACIVLGVLVVRVIYLVWLSPWELVGDEAYYWEWSRHLDWCYYEKGPGQALLIAPFVKLFGVHEWAVRMPMALLSAATAWMLGRLAVNVSGWNERAGLLAVVLFCVTPAFSANAQLCTQDGPMILIWSALAVGGLKLIRNWEAGGTRLWDWITPAIWMGVGFLFKQSILLFVLSLIVYAFVRRKRLAWIGRVAAYIIVGALIVGLFAIPMVIWNARHGWPTLEHTLGHLGAGGDHEIDDKSAYSPVKWFFSLLGTEVGAFGPAMLVLSVLACIAAIRGRRKDDQRWVSRLWMICCAVPSIAFFTGLSLWKEVLGNWPFPSFVTLVVLVADWGAGEWQRSRERPKTAFAVWWKIAVVYGAAGCVLLAFPNWLTRLPLSKNAKESILLKMEGHRAHVKELQAARKLVRAKTGTEPMIVARYYMVAALDAFYLEDHPAVFCAGTAFGKRPTAFDFWEDTDLSRPDLRGKPALLDKKVSKNWGDVLVFERVEDMGEACYLGIRYGGIRKR